MHTDQHGLKHYELTEKIIKVFFEVYNELGYGFLESVYEESISVALADAGLRVARQAPIAVWFRDHQVGDFRADARRKSCDSRIEVRSCPRPVT